MPAPRGFPTLLPLTNDSAAGEVILHKVTKYLDLGDIVTTALRYFGEPVTLFFDPITLTAYIITDPSDRDSLYGATIGDAYRILQPAPDQFGTNLVWVEGGDSGDVSAVEEASDKITQPQILKHTVGGILNTIHLNSNAFTVTDQNTGQVRLIVPSDATDLSARMAAIGLSGSGKRVIVKLNPPTAAVF